MKRKLIIPIILIAVIVFGAITYSNPSLKYHISQYNFIIIDECCRLVVPEVFQPKGFYGNELPDVKTTLYEMNFTKEEFIIGLASPTQLTFVDDDNLLILEKNSGHVRVINNGVLKEKPVYDFNVFSTLESGLVGILHSEGYVYIYVTESLADGEPALGNYIYRFNWDGSKLANKEIMNILPARDSIRHHGGAMAAGLDGTIYAVIGDLNKAREEKAGALQNSFFNEIDDTSVIIKVGLNKNELKPSESSNPFEHYRAIGIRNSFGLAIDPITGNLWQTENGWTVNSPDEINLVPTKFNSGWNITMGNATEEEISKMRFPEFPFSPPEFGWDPNIAPTALVFVENRWGEEFKNSLLVGSCNKGIIYKFELNAERDGFIFENEDLADLLLGPNDSDDEIVFVRDLGCVADMEFGPDNALYVSSISNNGLIYKIIPK